MNALAKEEVGAYVNKHYVASFQKVGTFRVEGDKKKGGNVATYFCSADGSVLHVVAGPVNGNVLLREARWVVETRNLALLESRNDLTKFKNAFRKAHLERLRREHRLDGGVVILPGYDSATPLDTSTLKDLIDGRRKLNNNGQVHLLLAAYPLVKVERLYRVVFEDILGEKISTLPVAKTG